MTDAGRLGLLRSCGSGQEGVVAFLVSQIAGRRLLSRLVSPYRAFEESVDFDERVDDQ